MGNTVCGVCVDPNEQPGRLNSYVTSVIRDKKTDVPLTSKIIF